MAKVTKKRKGMRKWNEEGYPGTSAREGGLYLDICAGVHEFIVMPLTMGSFCLLSEGRFEESVRSR